MFTGIVEEAGEVVEVQQGANAIRMSVQTALCGTDARIGDSIAVNGCCLTVVDIQDGPARKTVSFDLLRETWNRTNFRVARPGSLVNLERAMPANGRIHGHFVTGHIDGTGNIETFKRRGADWYLRIRPPAEILRYIVFKGSIAVDGISLTVAEVDDAAFAVWIIPHTYEVTALKQRAPGHALNLEADMLAKYVERIVARER